MSEQEKHLFNINKEEKFSEWFNTVLRLSDIVDDRYPAKGMYYYPWYGLKLIKNCIRIMERLLEDSGHREEKYPCLIPWSLFKKEKDFLEGFSPEAYLIEKTLKKEKLEEPLILRPTSETAIYPMWSLRIKSHRDLPLKIYQTVNIFRCETKMTKPLLRLREVVFFNEAHTAHKTKEEADKQIKEAIKIYKKFYDNLLIPYLIVEIPKWELFPGAEYQYDFITVMPDGKGLELGSIINLGQKFAKAFNIIFQDVDLENKYVWQTCYGIAERSVGALIGIHGDNKGLILPPHLAPIQIVIIPIIFKGKENVVLNKCKEIYEKLSKDYRVELDDDDSRKPGWKFYYWELKGVPLRIEIGPRDVENKTVTIVRRDTGEKIVVEEDKLKETIEKLFNDIIENLRKRSKEWFLNKIKITENLEDFEKYVKETVVIAPLCNKKECAEKIKEKYNREAIGYLKEGLNISGENKCILCGEKARWSVIAKMY